MELERRLVGCSKFLTQVGKVEMVNVVLSSLPTFFMCNLKILATIINQINQYRRYGLWRGLDIDIRKQPLAAWKLVTGPKREGGLGVISLKTHNEALLMKQLHKFLNKKELPWVKLIWENYYRNG